MKREEDIFTELYVPQYRRLFGMAMALLADRDDAADAVQETMVKIWNLRATLADVQNPEGFAARILRTTAIDMLRRRRPVDDIEAAVRTVAADDPPDVDAAETVQRIIDTLPPGQQTVIRLSAFDDRPPDEIARLTGLSPANVRQLLCRGRKKIREIYQKLMQQ